LIYGQVFTARPIEYEEGENKYVKGISFSYPRYENDIEVLLQTPWFINKYGIPKLNKYNKTDEDRTYINLPLIKNEETNSFIDSGIKFRNAPDSGFNEGEEKKINLWQ
jgi:hypothetical protein